MGRTERNRAFLVCTLVAAALAWAIPAAAPASSRVPKVPNLDNLGYSADPGAPAPAPTPAPEPQPEPEPQPPAEKPKAGVSLEERKGGELITYGDEIKLAGKIDSKKKGKKVKVLFSEAGKKGADPVDVIKTGKKGKFSLKDKPKFTGTYSAKVKDASSDSVPVEVKPLIELNVEENTLEGDKVQISGELKPAIGHRKVVIERTDKKKGWDKVGKADVDGKGFKSGWKPKDTGEYRLRARFAGDDLNRGARQKDKANVYRESVASHYGNGFYGSKTACGQTLGKNTLGVANKQIPCGTKVTFYHRGRSVKVPVIDRGPYVGGRDWDLTTATARKLKVSGVEKIWSTR
ncbi:MAG: rare lipoprotein [Thermoleophilaceae bacterium]|jgi:hypothetical protein|nr:rare lipoprotein [Thermoleophilaceae bacterium]